MSNLNPNLPLKKNGIMYFIYKCLHLFFHSHGGWNHNIYIFYKFYL